MGLIVDSTAWIAGERARSTVPEVLKDIHEGVGDQEVAISVMSAAELVHGIWRAAAPRIRVRREEFVEEIFARVPLRPVSLRIARIAGEVDAMTRSRGVVVPTTDLFIGATALEIGFSVVTHNLRHFQQIPGLQVVQL